MHCMFVNRCVYASAYARYYHYHITLMMLPPPPYLMICNQGFCSANTKPLFFLIFAYQNFKWVAVIK